MAWNILKSVCIPITESTAVNAFRAAQKAKAQVQWIEMRLDYLKSSKEIEQLFHFIERLKTGQHQLIFTLRRRGAGGKFHGPVRAQLRWLKRASEFGQWIDIEIETIEKSGRQALEDLRDRGAKTIVSYHNFNETPSNLRAVTQRLLSTRADIIKIATQTNTMSDAVRLLDWQQALQREGRKSVVLGMGPSGIATRVLALSRGAVFTFAALAQGKGSAAGQPTVEELRNLYRIDRLNSRTQVFGIVGHPLAHSLSPAVYNTAFGLLNMNAVYLPFETPSLTDFLHWAKRMKISGLSVTLPHKVKIMRYLSTIDPVARQAGAVNTIRVSKGQRHGYNTDIRGIAQPMDELDLRLKGADVLLLGAGGVAQAAVALLTLKGARVFICNRTHSSAERLARKFKQHTVRQDDLTGKHFDLLINATRLGMWPEGRSIPVDFSRLSAAVVFDFVYNPAETRLLREARRQKSRVISGVEMFLAQAKEQFKILTGKELPPAALKVVAPDVRP